MAIDYRGLRSLTARERISALKRDGFSLSGKQGRISATGMPMVGGSRWRRMGAETRFR